MSTDHYDLRCPDCNKSFSSSFHCWQTFKQWPVKWNNGNIATSVSTRWMWWKSSVILSAAQLGRLFAEPPRRQTVCWSKDKAGVENSETHRYSFNTFPWLSGQLELEGVAAVVMGVAHSTGRNSILKKHWKRRKKKSWGDKRIWRLPDADNIL